MPDNDRQLALAFVAEMEKALASIRSGDPNGIAYAELQPTALSLLEGSQRMHVLLREGFSAVSCDPPVETLLDKLAESDYELACVIDRFMIAVCELVNSDPSSSQKP